MNEKDLQEVIDILTSLAKGEQKPAFKGQDKYIRLFLELHRPKENTPHITFRFDNPQLIKSLVETLEELKKIPMGEAEIVKPESLSPPASKS